jgi:hypothetical protein
MVQIMTAVESSSDAIGYLTFRDATSIKTKPYPICLGIRLRKNYKLLAVGRPW